MITKNVMMLMCVFASLAFSKIEAQVAMENGETFDFEGHYEFKDENGGLYKLWIWDYYGTYGAELVYDSETISYFIECEARYIEGKDRMFWISFKKEKSGTFPQESELTGESADMFAIAFRGEDLVKEHLYTVIKNLDIVGYENNSINQNVFKKIDYSVEE